MTQIRTLLHRGALAGALVLGAACREEPVAETPPRQLSASTFQYPEELWDAGVSGETLLRIHIGPEGGVDTVRVEKSSGHAAFDTAAARGARELRFAPATRGGEPVAVWRLLPVQFDPQAAPPRPGSER